MSLRASWSWGSRVKLQFKWGDGSSDLQMYPDNARESECSHVYARPGIYYPSVSIWNYLIDCSNQTLQLRSNNTLLPVEIFIPLLPIEDFKVTPTLAAWCSMVPFNLSVFIGYATLVNLTIDWDDNTSDFLYMERLTNDMHKVFQYASNFCNLYIFFP